MIIMFGKVFASCFTGSMSGSGSDMFAVWAYILANANKDGSIELNPKIMAVAIGMPEASVQKVLTKLQQPDPNSRCKDEDGKRLIKSGEFFYEIVNYVTYRDIQNIRHRNDYMRKYMQDKRILEKVKNSLKNEDSPKVLESVSNVSLQVDTDTDRDRDREEDREINTEGDRDCKEKEGDELSTKERRTELRKKGGLNI